MKVKSLRLSQLSSTANQSFFGDSSVNIEAFGQSESITNRLRTILDLYPDGSPIFSELIQNADDAGATVVRFLVDNQTYSVESLMDPKMAALQGPSLLVYNNAVFSEADFRNLARIGQASKIEKLATTGRFGLGFSSAYHISDTPSFVSGEHMVIFDPHCAYVPGANTNQPGLRVKFVGNKLTTLFKDQFQPFNYFGCDFNDSYPGTLFRFPLRTTSLARKSEISKRAYSVEEMTENLNSLARQFSNYLLFLRSVRTIEIYCRDADTGEVALLHSANAEVHNTRVTNDQALMRFFDKNHDSSRESGSDVVNTNIQSRDDFYSTLMSTVDAKLPSSTSIVIINIRSYFSSHVSEEIVSDSSESISLQSAERTPTSSQEIEFIVMVGLRGGAAKRMACSSTLRHLKLVPLGSVAACLRRKVTTLTPSTELVTEEELFPKLSGQVFCFLPLPINTQLPVHLNAYWELSSNRRDIWSGDDTTGEAKLRSDWNLAIMTDVLAPLYADLIVYLSKNQSNVSLSSCLQLLSLLPCPLPNTHWRVTASALFPLIRSEKLLYSCLNNGTTLSPQKCFIMEIFDDTTNLVAKRLESLLLLEKIPVVTVPVEVMKVFVDTGSVAGVVNPKLVRSYFNGSNLKVSTRYDPSSRQGFSFSSLQISGSILTRQDAFQNALFLLDVCMQEIKTDEYADLLNIPLVPLEDGCLGVIGSSIDIPLYLASDAERRLLTGSKSHLIVSEAVLGPTISVVFKNPVFHEVSNIRPLSSIDVLRLLKSTVPLEWFVESCTVVDYEDFVSTEWMICLWTYVLEAKCLPMYKDMLPILPVMSHCESINNIVGPKRSLAVKMVDSVPVMAYADLPMDLSNVLLSLGIYIFDINVLGRLSYENEITVHLLPQTGRGYLQAFQQIGINRLKQASSVWSPSTCDLFRNFILDTIVDKVDSISADEQTLLRSLSIWKGNSNTSLGHSNVHTPLEEKLLPPKGISADLLTGKYLSIRGDQDRKLYQLVGVQPEQSRTQFYMEHFIPQASAGAYDNSLLDSTVVNLVTHCSLFESECQGFKDVLGKSKLFRNAAGILVTATELYDPEVTSFISLLPPSMFPSVALTKYPSTLHMLRSLGMNIRMSIEGVLQAANAIPEDLNTLISSTSQDLLSDQTEDELETTSKLAKIRRRSTELLGYIDAHIEDLLECADPDSLSTLRERRLSGEPIFDMTVGADFGRELRSIQFVLCHTAKPISGPEQRALPWPEAIHKHPFAAPSQCASIDQLWLCSQSRRIVFSNIKSDLTRALFGWNEHTVISGRTVALQMIKLKDLYDDIVGSSAEQDSSLVPFFQLYQSLSLKFLEVLSSCFTSESESEVSFWLQALSGRSYLWVDKKFLETDKIAFSAPSNISLEPYFYLVPVQYQIYGDLLRAMGVKESFNPIDMMKTISELHKMSPNIQLPPAKHRMSIGVLKFIAKILIEQNRDMTKNSDDINAQVVGQIVDASLVSDSEAPVPVIATGTVVPASSESIPPLEPLFVLSISQLGEVFIPSDTGILYKASALTFDDAPWISSSIRRSSSGRSSSNLIFVCQDLSEDEAAVLGVKSLRKQLFTGDEIICPDANALKQMIAGDTFVDLLKDILVLADGVLRAKSLHIAFDERQHPTESLMNPGLSTTQGPSLVICIDGPVLSGETISQYLSMPTQLQGITQPVGSLSTIDTELKLYPKGGKRLVSSFVLTDNLQVISGNEFFLFDPTGDIILQDSASGKTKGVKRGKAQKANLTGRGQEEGILQQFPDQFSPFTTLPFGITPGSLNGFQGTMIRIPLRQKGSIVSQNVANVNDIKFGLRALKQLSECSLLFGSSLTNINCYHCLSSSTSATLDFQVIKSLIFVHT